LQRAVRRWKLEYFEELSPDIPDTANGIPPQMKKLLEDFRRGNNMINPAPFFFGYLGEHAAFYTAGARQLAGDVSFRGDLYQASRREYFLYLVM
jgi:hypothetical protein